MKTTLSLSGGKDSTYLLLELIRRGTPPDECVFFDTGWEFPQMYRHIDRLRDLCKLHGIQFVTLHPERDFDYLMFEKPVKETGGGQHFGYSWCGARGVRWGTTEKTRILDQHNRGTVVMIGIAADETERLAKERGPGKVFPLAEWGITEAECLAGCYAAGYDWDGLYEKLDRVSCACCAAKNLKELRNIYNDMPEVWADLQRRQEMTERPFKGPGKSVPELAIRFELEKKWIAEGKSVKSREFYEALAEALREEAPAWQH